MVDATTTFAPSTEATHHWLSQRLTAGANLLLMLWFMASIAMLPAYDYATVASWLAQPMAAIPMLLLVVATFYHARLGLEVVIEDYQSDQSRVVLIVLTNFFTLVIAATAIFSILKVAFTTAA